MKSYWTTRPAEPLKTDAPPLRPKAHVKMQRFWRQRTDEQVMEMINCLERTLATHGMSPKHLRATLIAWTATQP